MLRKDEVLKECALLCVEVLDKPNEIELVAPPGWRFSGGEHALVFARWDGATKRSLWDAAWEAVFSGFGLEIVRCPKQCPCSE